MESNASRILRIMRQSEELKRRHLEVQRDKLEAEKRNASVTLKKISTKLADMTPAERDASLSHQPTRGTRDNVKPEFLQVIVEGNGGQRGRMGHDRQNMRQAPKNRRDGDKRRQDRGRMDSSHMNGLKQLPAYQAPVATPKQTLDPVSDEECDDFFTDIVTLDPSLPVDPSLPTEQADMSRWTPSPGQYAFAQRTSENYPPPLMSLPQSLPQNSTTDAALKSFEPSRSESFTRQRSASSSSYASDNVSQSGYSGVSQVPQQVSENHMALDVQNCSISTYQVSSGEEGTRPLYKNPEYKETSRMAPPSAQYQLVRGLSADGATTTEMPGNRESFNSASYPRDLNSSESDYGRQQTSVSYMVPQQVTGNSSESDYGRQQTSVSYMVPQQVTGNSSESDYGRQQTSVSYMVPQQATVNSSESDYGRQQTSVSYMVPQQSTVNSSESDYGRQQTSVSYMVPRQVTVNSSESDYARQQNSVSYMVPQQVTGNMLYTNVAAGSAKYPQEVILSKLDGYVPLPSSSPAPRLVSGQGSLLCRESNYPQDGVLSQLEGYARQGFCQNTAHENISSHLGAYQQDATNTRSPAPRMVPDQTLYEQASGNHVPMYPQQIPPDSFVPQRTADPRMVSEHVLSSRNRAVQYLQQAKAELDSYASRIAPEQISSEYQQKVLQSENPQRFTLRMAPDQNVLVHGSKCAQEVVDPRVVAELPEFERYASHRAFVPSMVPEQGTSLQRSGGLPSSAMPPSPKEAVQPPSDKTQNFLQHIDFSKPPPNLSGRPKSPNISDRRQNSQLHQDSEQRSGDGSQSDAQSFAEYGELSNNRTVNQVARSLSPLNSGYDAGYESQSLDNSGKNEGFLVEDFRDMWPSANNSSGKDYSSNAPPVMSSTPYAPFRFPGEANEGELPRYRPILGRGASEKRSSTTDETILESSDSSQISNMPSFESNQGNSYTQRPSFEERSSTQQKPKKKSALQERMDAARMDSSHRFARDLNSQRGGVVEGSYGGVNISFSGYQPSSGSVQRQPLSDQTPIANNANNQRNQADAMQKPKVAQSSFFACEDIREKEKRLIASNRYSGLESQCDGNERNPSDVEEKGKLEAFKGTESLDWAAEYSD